MIIFYLTYKLYSFSLIILEIEDAIEESLDAINERYKSVGKILSRDIFFDSVEVRQVISDIQLTHAAILRIANKLTNISRKQNEIEKENIEG
jgi:hypothetical protein